jgi:hypothetical protein
MSKDLPVLTDGSADSCRPPPHQCTEASWVLLLLCRIVGGRELPCLAEHGKRETEVMPR